jgi:Holliday junction resolvasome RuvABC endonuclease subunit
MSTIKYTIIITLSIWLGWFAREHVASDRVTRVLHQIEDTTQTIQADHVALERHLESRDTRDQMTFELFERVLHMIERDQPEKVAIDTPQDYNQSR